MTFDFSDCRLYDDVVRAFGASEVQHGLEQQHVPRGVSCVGRLVCISQRVHVYVCMHMCMCVCMYISIYMCMRIGIRIRACIGLSIYLYSARARHLGIRCTGMMIMDSRVNMRFKGSMMGLREHGGG